MQSSLQKSFFGEDLIKRADEALKAKRLANKLTGSNVANGNSRGRGYQNWTYLQYQNKRSEFPQYQNQWQYAYQIGTTEARGTQTDRRERLPQIQEIATSQVHQPPIIDNLKNTPDNFYGGLNLRTILVVSHTKVRLFLIAQRMN